MEKKRILFLCSQNRLRSPTAESIFSNKEGFEVKSAGLGRDAVVPATSDLIEWADYIFVMEESHKKKLKNKFKSYLKGQRIICLDIPDEYEYMDDGLILLLTNKLGIFFQNT